MKLTKEQYEFLKVLEDSMGVISLALDTSGVSREDYDMWMEEVRFKTKVEEVSERLLDYVENRLLRQINEGNLQAIQFYLKTKGRNRGYV